METFVELFHLDLSLISILQSVNRSTHNLINFLWPASNPLSWYYIWALWSHYSYHIRWDENINMFAVCLYYVSREHFQDIYIYLSDGKQQYIRWLSSNIKLIMRVCPSYQFSTSNKVAYLKIDVRVDRKRVVILLTEINTTEERKAKGWKEE